MCHVHAVFAGVRHVWPPDGHDGFRVYGLQMVMTNDLQMVMTNDLQMVMTNDLQMVMTWAMTV